MIIDLLLFGRQRGIAHLQFKSLDHIFAAVEPEHQIITGRQAFRDPVCFLIKLRQLIGILLVVFFLQILFQDLDLLIDR